jgi:hypothetical protein
LSAPLRRDVVAGALPPIEFRRIAPASRPAARAATTLLGTVLQALAVGLACSATAQADDRRVPHTDEHPAPLSAAERPPVVFAPVWDALIGRWLGQGGTASADGTGVAGVTGAASFDYELDGRVLVRRNVADYPTAKGRPGLHHEDLMTIYPAPDGLHAEAMYYDNEGHVIHYAATWASDGRSLVLLSFPEDGAPRYRLTWTFAAFDKLSLTFDIAPAGTADFSSYAGGTLQRAGH